MPDRDYRNLQFASTTHLLTGLGFTDVTLAYMDHPFGADQFYGPYTSWEDTKTWWAGVQQALGKKTTASFAYRRHSDLFVLLRDDPAVYTNHHHDESYQAAVRRRENPRAERDRLLRRRGAARIHRQQQSGHPCAQPRRGLCRGGFPRAEALLAFRFGARGGVPQLLRRVQPHRSRAASGSRPVLKFRASASRAFRVPTYTDLYYSDPANQGNPHLLPEHAWTYESGLDWTPSSRVRGAVTVFERRERNGIDYYRTSPDAVWQALNIDNLNFTGVESSLRVDAGPHSDHRLPLYLDAGHAGHRPDRLHQVHLQLPDRFRRGGLAGRFPRAAVPHAPGRAEAARLATRTLYGMSTPACRAARCTRSSRFPTSRPRRIRRSRASRCPAAP